MQALQSFSSALASGQLGPLMHQFGLDDTAVAAAQNGGLRALLSSCCLCNFLSFLRTQPFNGLWSGTTRVGRYQKKHSPTHVHPDLRTSFIIFLHLQGSMASSLFVLRAWQSSRTTSLQVLFGRPLGLGPSTSYSIHVFTQSSSSFRSTCPYQCSVFCCNISAMSSIPCLSLNCLLGSLSFSLTPHINLPSILPLFYCQEPLNVGCMAP